MEDDTTTRFDCPSEYCAPITPNWYDPIGLDYVDGYDTKYCEPMYEWQMSAYPTCNAFHEIHMDRLKVINSGGSRTAYEMNIEDGSTAKFVYKTVKYSKDIDQKRIDEQRKDSLIMERTTKSQFIPNVYGYCSLAVQMDYMPEGNMHQYIKASRLAGGSSLAPVDKLRLAIHVVTSVADLHTIDNTAMPSVFHNDLCCHQYLFQNGIFKLNDFNYLRPIYINKQTQEQCTRIQFNMAMWKARSLEEHRYYAGDRTYTGCKPDKVDVWMMGNLIYYILTDLYTFEKPTLLSWKDAGRELLSGRRSALPPHIVNSDDPSYIAIIKALDMCWTQDWEKRPSARHISNYLLLKLRIITGEKEPDLRVVLPERDPNMSNTESDYEYHND
jgi:serine/threonine protein kinase